MAVTLVILFCEKCAEKCQRLENGYGSGTGLLGILTLVVLSVVGIVVGLRIATTRSLGLGIAAAVSWLATGASSLRANAQTLRLGSMTVASMRGSAGCGVGCGL